MKKYLFSKPLVEISEVSEKLGINKNALYNGVHAKEIPAIKLGRYLICVAEWSVTAPFCNISANQADTRAAAASFVNNEAEPAEPVEPEEMEKKSVDDAIIDALNSADRNCISSTKLHDTIISQGYSEHEFKRARCRLRKESRIDIGHDGGKEWVVRLISPEYKSLIDEFRRSMQAAPVQRLVKKKISISQGQIDAISAEAKTNGTNFSQQLRNILDEWITNHNSTQPPHNRATNSFYRI